MFSRLRPRSTLAITGLGAGVGGSFWLKERQRVGCEPCLERKQHHQVVIVGGGSGGMSVASQLIRKLGSNVDVCVVEPSNSHYYQAAWTMVGGGLYDVQDSVRPMGKVLPSAATWYQEQCQDFKPDENKVVLADGSELTYNYLVTAAGIQIDWNKIEGLEETLGSNGVSSNYSWRWAPKTWENIEKTKKGVAIFTDPTTPVKCGGAPQKIAYLAEDHWRKVGTRDDIDVIFATGRPSIFAVPPVSKALERVQADKNISARCGCNLVKVDGPNHVATFKKTDGSMVEEKFDFLHVPPPMSAPDCIRNSSLANEAGFVDVDRLTLQHAKYRNVFAIGDCAGTPNSKTYAAISAQAPVVVENLQAAMHGKEPSAKYDGYSCCPIMLGGGKTMMAEFKYGGELCGTFKPFLKETEPSSLFFLMKRYVFPIVYFNFAPLGRWYGKRGVFEPSF
jgi:sulfide:quinone oxidoreductase